MRRFTVFFLIFGAGCDPSNTPRSDQGPKDHPTTNAQPVESKPKHDYQGWKKYAPAEGGFEVRFPKEPVLTNASPATGNLYMAGVKRQSPGELGYNCQWLLREKPAANKDVEKAFLRGQQQGALQALNGKLVEESEITLGDASGRHLIIEITSDNLLQYRTYISGRLVVILQVGGKDLEALRSKNAAMFFDSLRIGK